ncbi:MAG: diguanylate cyclase [Pseudomonadota bacterium]|nr:diguanylate cyclase [Pseudomonadota bacterium]
MANNKDETEEPTAPGEKTSVISGDTFKGRLAEAVKEPPCLVLLVGPTRYIGKQWPITGTDLIIGRASQSQIYIDDRSVSKSHAKIILSELNEVSIVDLESTNKTVINGRPVPSLTPVRLQNNDQLKTGNVIFKFLERGNIEAMTSKDIHDRTQLDGLTKIFNKSSLLEHGIEAFKRAQLMQFPITVINFDLDHFKNVNDTHGHLAGDYVLKEIAELVKTKFIRGDDFFARFGGEEFVIILHGSTAAQGLEIAERIRLNIQKHQFVFEGNKLPITISAGVAEKSPSMADWDDLYKKSDMALYQSKNSGRNKVTKGTT